MRLHVYVYIDFANEEYVDYSYWLAPRLHALNCIVKLRNIVMVRSGSAIMSN
jgi:hypothetical protein